MWLLSLRDLEWRRRRFIIAVLATALVFAMTILMTGITTSMRAENKRVVDGFGADAWMVARGTSGPFTASTVISASEAGRVRAVAGVRAADPVIVFRSTIGRSTLQDVNILGFRPGGIGTPELASGRMLRRKGEVLADAGIGLASGDRIRVSGHDLQVVGTVNDVTYYFGTPTLMLAIDDAQEVAFAGRPLVTAIVTRGVPTRAPDGLRALSNGAAVSDLQRPMKSSDQTLGLVNGLLWLVAAGIIGSIVYLSALERSRDFAVLKATGAASRTLLGALVVEAVLLSLAAAAVAAIIALLLAPAFPFSVAIPMSAYVWLAVVALVVGGLASLAGLRRAVHADPAFAFGGA